MSEQEADQARDYSDRPCVSDAWGITVIGIPRQQRHESGRGFKPIQAAEFDYNASHWLDKPLGYLTQWLPDPASLAVGDVIFLYDESGPDAFGFLFRVTEIGQRPPLAPLDSPVRYEAATLVPDSPIRFQPRPYEEPGDNCEVVGRLPEGYGRDSSYTACPHMSPTTSSGPGHVTVACSECAPAPDAPRAARTEGL